MKYEKPEVKMFEFEIEDVITTSMPFPTDPTNPNPSTNAVEKVDYGELL